MVDINSTINSFRLLKAKGPIRFVRYKKKCNCCKWYRLYKSIGKICPLIEIKKCLLFKKTNKTSKQLKKELDVELLNFMKRERGKK